MRIRVTTVAVAAVSLALGPGVSPGQSSPAGPSESVRLLAQARSQAPASPGSAPGSVPGPSRALSGPVTLEPGLPGLQVYVKAPSHKEMTELLQAIKTANIGGGSFTYYLGALENLQKVCKTKNYTVEDQKAAGCQATETLSQCGVKLYKHCMATNQTPEHLKQAAKYQLEVAEQMAALLKKYATRVQDAVNVYAP